MTAFFLLTSLALRLQLAAASIEVFAPKASLRATVDAATAQLELQSALGEALGCGGQVSHEHLQDIEKSLMSMERTLPLNSQGRFDRRSLRHLAYRYFTQRYSIVVRGFEPSLPTADGRGRWGNAAILAQRLPGLVESVLESRHAERGFDLHDAAFVVAAVERLIFEEESHVLAKAYEAKGRSPEQSLPGEEMQQVMEDYLVRWLMGDDEEGTRLLLDNRTLLDTSFPHWKDLEAFGHGQIRALTYSQQKSSQLSGKAFETRYSYQDAHSIAGSITRSFASFWQSECAGLQESLVSMDPFNTGRVPLSKFYGTGLDEDWRFGESESYLRELGALDETGARKQVIIPNYIQAASNCIVTTQHYMICCTTECNDIMTEIESKIAKPTAEATLILEVVSNMTLMSSMEDEGAVRVDDALAAQLRSVEAAHGGEVPLHGRLYLQWLHYVFPRECPFPHKTGSTAVTAPSEFSGDYVATLQEMQAMRASENDTVLPHNVTVAKEELQWMSQWSEEEELLLSYEGLSDSSTWRRRVVRGGLLALLFASVAGTAKISQHKGSSYHRQLPV